MVQAVVFFRYVKKRSVRQARNKFGARIAVHSGASNRDSAVAAGAELKLLVIQLHNPQGCLLTSWKFRCGDGLIRGWE